MDNRNWQTSDEDIEHARAGGRTKTAGLGLLGPAVERVVKRKVGRMRDRLAHLIARTALESATARRLVFQLLVRQLTTDEARRLNQAAWTGSVDSLRKPSEGLREILGPRANTPEPPRSSGPPTPPAVAAG